MQSADLLLKVETLLRIRRKLRECASSCGNPTLSVSGILIELPELQLQLLILPLGIIELMLERIVLLKGFVQLGKKRWFGDVGVPHGRQMWVIALPGCGALDSFC